MKASEVDMKSFEKECQQYILRILKFFEKNAYGDKTEKKKIMKETMVEMFDKLRKKICTTKNQALD